MYTKKIRKAIGAIVFQNNKYLLVHKVRSVDCNEAIVGHWDFVKGGMKESDEDLETAAIRELLEETGSNSYKIIRSFDKKICFTFPETHKYERQETVMFYVEYLGDGSDLKPQDEEIDEIKFFNKDEVLNILIFEETRKFLDEELW